MPNRKKLKNQATVMGENSKVVITDRKIKEKGSTIAKEKAKAGKYKSIAAAKKAGALYYTNKEGKVMAAVYAEDLKKPIKKATAPKTSLRPKARPKKEPPVAKPADYVPHNRGGNYLWNESGQSWDANPDYTPYTP